MSHVLRHAARTDRGLLRANNQDSVFAGARLMVIADGMGGHAAGDVASRLVVAAFVDLDELPLGGDMVRPLAEATREGNAAIAEMVDENPALDGMGTTLTALLFDGPVVALAHVGDSRAYLYRNGVLHQISHDDTFVQSLVDDGRITADEAAHHPQRSLLLRALNGTEMDPSITMRETSAGDRFLICSDGLSDVVSPEAIADALGGTDPDSVADSLIQLALVGGGPDNVTVIVADVVETGSPSALGAHAGGIDPEATGPMQPIHLTQVMPNVPLPPIPEDVAAKPEYASPEEGPHLEDDDYDDDYDEEDDESDDGGYTTGTPDEFDTEHSPQDQPGHRQLVSPPSRRNRPRRWALGVAVVVLIGVVAGGSVLWAGTKYYVGDNGDQVAVFRGLNGSLLGWKFASVQENSCGTSTPGCTPLKVNDLVQAARDQVNAGIPVSTLADARAVITRLTSQQLPPCPTPGAPTTVVISSGAASSSNTSASTSNPSTPVTPTSTPAPLAPPVKTTAAKRSPAPTTPVKTAPKQPATAVHPDTSAKTSFRTLTTRTIAPPTPVTTTVTVTVTVTVDQQGVGASQAGQRLRTDRIAGALATTAAKPPAAASARVSTTPGPITRAGITGIAPTVTVTRTATSTRTAPSTPTSTGTPLVSPAAEPGVTCRVVS